MKIYTRTGDKGETSLHGGRRVPKDDLRIDAYGHVDELNSWIGLVRSHNPERTIDSVLASIQNDLFVLGADLATPLDIKKAGVTRIEPHHIQKLEQEIDSIEEKLEPLASFILPGGSTLASHLHIARTICRRAECRVVRLSKDVSLGPHPLVYLNRLSDLLFVLSRFANRLTSMPETRWPSAD